MAASEHVQPISRRQDALAIVQTLQRAGHVAYFAGGCVRDMLWKLTPKDFDVATDAPPQRVKALFPRSQGVGQAFGVLLVRMGHSVIEVATFRADGSYTDGRRPDDVRFATPKEDAQRRDFTINGLFFDPVTEQVIDYVNGQADLEKRILRAIGDPAARFAEDYLRMMRAVRFTARFSLALDPGTAEAIRTHAHKLPRIAPERICDELRATFATGDPRVTAGLLDELRLTPVLLRGLVDAAGTAPRRLLFPTSAYPESFSLQLTLFLLDSLRGCGPDLLLCFAPDRAHDLVQRLRHSFRLSNEETAEIRTILTAGSFLLDGFPSTARLKRYLALPASRLGLVLLRRLRAAGMEAGRIDALLSQMDAFPPDEIAPPPLLDGTDLQAMGYAPGPAFKRVLDAVYDAQLELQIREKSQATALAQRLMQMD